MLFDSLTEAQSCQQPEKQMTRILLALLMSKPTEHYERLPLLSDEVCLPVIPRFQPNERSKNYVHCHFPFFLSFDRRQMLYKLAVHNPKAPICQHMCDPLFFLSPVDQHFFHLLLFVDPDTSQYVPFDGHKHFSLVSCFLQYCFVTLHNLRFDKMCSLQPERF